MLLSIDLDIVCTDRQIGAPDRRENTVRVIGEILPFVIAMYGIDPVDRQPDASRESGQIFVG
ncbi:MAG: hypothetical protein HY288_11605 [Planctomycetia bacterium]|nr:hypothetical protein [Planctomycetia bacterium]